jgi:ATP phosphoribosyltransferase regulatory subunit HisZ
MIYPANDSEAVELGNSLQQIPSLQEVNVSHNNLDGEQAAALIESLKHSSIRVLNLSNNQIGIIGAAELAQSLGDTNVEELNLTDASIDGTWLKEFTEALQKHKTSLKKIDLHENLELDSSLDELRELAELIPISVNDELADMLNLKQVDSDDSDGMWEEEESN